MVLLDTAVVVDGVVEAGAEAVLVDDAAPEWCFMKCSSLLHPPSATTAVAQMRIERRM